MRQWPVNWFFYSEGQSIFLHSQDTDSFTWPPVYTETVPMGKANHHLFYLFMRTIKPNFPVLAKIWSYSVTFVRERLQLLRWFFTWTTHLCRAKKFVFTAQGSTSNICYSGKGTLRRCMCHFGCLLVAPLQFRWSVGYGPLWRMTESSSVLENGLNLLLKTLWR